MPVPEDVELTFPDDGGCFGCSPTHPAGLLLRFRRLGERVVARYERPCPVEAPLELVATITDRAHPRYWVVEAEIHHAGARVARSRGKFFLRGMEPVAP